MDMYWWGYGLGFLVTGFKWSISREVSDELLLGMWVVSLECYVGFFRRWHVEF